MTYASSLTGVVTNWQILSRVSGERDSIRDMVNGWRLRMSDVASSSPIQFISPETHEETGQFVPLAMDDLDMKIILVGGC